MKKTRIIMGMPVTVEIIDDSNQVELYIDKVFDYFVSVDDQFSTYKVSSEISRINAGLEEEHWSQTMKHVMSLCRQTARLTGGYFDISRNGKIDPSGLVKGWSIDEASKLISAKFSNYYIEAGGDIAVSGFSGDHQPWRIGIRNPKNINEIVKTVSVKKGGVATSGNYIRGNHIYNPKTGREVDNPISLTVIGPSIYEADRYATAAYAMGVAGINLIEKTDGLEGYMIDREMLATKTTNFESYEV